MSSPLRPEPARRITWLDLLAIVAITFAVFAPVLRSDFSPLDDYMMLTNNRKMTEPSWDALRSFWSGPAFRIYMPLAQTLWQATALLSYTSAPVSGVHILDAIGFKIVSVTTHALAAAAAAWAIGVLTRTRWPALLGGLLFALHPLQVESVAWTTGLKDELCGLFGCLSVGWYALHVRRGRPIPWHDAFWWLSFAAALLATLSKPSAMVLPILLLATDWALRRASAVRRFVSVGLFLLPAIGCALVIVNVQSDPVVPRVGLPLRPLVAADSYAFYLLKLVWPVRVTVDYGRLPTLVVASGAVWWTWLVPAAVVGGLVWLRSRLAWLAAVLFAVPILPVSGITPFDMQQYSTVTDHYAYLSMLGAGLGLALVLAWRPSLTVVAGLALAGLAVVTFREGVPWRSAEEHYRQILARNPRSWLARDLLSRIAINRGDLYSAKRLSQESLELNPTDGMAMDTQAYVLELSGQYRAAADGELAATAFFPVERADTSKRLAQLGAKLNDRDLAEKGVRLWLRADPENPFARETLLAFMRAKQQEAATRAATRSAK